MENKIFTVSIIGCGSRGADVYGSIASRMPEKYKIVSACEKDPSRLEYTKNKFGIADEDAFTDENEFFKKKRADLIFITTQDRDHVRMCLKALELGYDILLEKPITEHKEECMQLLEAHKKYGGKVLVCHVLRYCPPFLKAKEILDSGILGRLVCINTTEQVAYWHQAHSFVRGNWRSREECVPMILAKCCHDLDLLQYYAGSKCKCISSIGSLSYFTKENAPEGCAERCTDCKYNETCPYSAVKIYYDNWVNDKMKWPATIVMRGLEMNAENLYERLKTSPYGRCVFHCDNDVVDNQITQMTFENGVNATLTMTAFTARGGRYTRFHCTVGELILDEENGVIEVKKFGEDKVTLNINDLTLVKSGHGGGDYGLMVGLYDALTGHEEGRTTLESSIESHLMGIAAEESRLADGKLIYIHE